MHVNEQREVRDPAARAGAFSDFNMLSVTLRCLCVALGLSPVALALCPGCVSGRNALVLVALAPPAALVLATLFRSRFGWILFGSYLAVGAVAGGGLLWTILTWRGDRISGNEPSAIFSLKTLVTAEERHRKVARTYGTLSQLSAGSPPCIDRALAAGKKSGYSFVLVVGKPASSNYYATARPVIPGKTGNRRFFVDSSCVIRYCARKGGSATSGDSPIE